MLKFVQFLESDDLNQRKRKSYFDKSSNYCLAEYNPMSRMIQDNTHRKALMLHKSPVLFKSGYCLVPHFYIRFKKIKNRAYKISPTYITNDFWFVLT